jgi:lipid A 4'-phosphatase
MTIRGLATALIIGALTGLIFGLFPGLDLAISDLFYDRARGEFTPRLATFIFYARELGRCIVGALVLQAVVALVIKLFLTNARMLMPGRAVVLIIATFLLAPGLVANVLLKDNWGRPRPTEVTQFGGTQQFRAWWDPRGDCEKNCSFVSGDGSAAFWTVAPAAVAPPAYRPLAMAAALAFGAGVGSLRVMSGGHFFSDTVFAGVIAFIIVWIVHGLLYRWPATRSSDQAIEDAIAALVRAVRRPLRPAWNLFHRVARDIYRRFC